MLSFSTSTSATGHITPMDQDTGTVGDIMSGFLGIGARITESGTTVITDGVSRWLQLLDE